MYSFPAPVNRSSGEVMFRSDDPEFGLRLYAAHKGIPVPYALGPFGAAVDRGVYPAAQARTHGFQHSEHVAIGEAIAQHHQIDIARSCVPALGDGTIHERSGDLPFKGR